MLELIGLGKTFGKLTALESLSLTLAEGEDTGNRSMEEIYFEHIPPMTSNGSALSWLTGK